MKDYMQAMIEAALQAGTIIKNAFSGDFQISEKEKKENVSDFVTAIDKASDHKIISVLNQRVPSVNVVTEESGGIENGKYFLVDPLDGTTNFVTGIDYFSVSIAYIEKGKIVAGCVYDPIRDNMFYAIKGEGSYLNNIPVKVKTTPLNKTIFIQEENFGGTRQKEILERTALLTTGIAGLRKTGSTALDLAYISAGKPWFVLASGVKPWDVAAGAIIAQEAGATVTSLAGEKYDLQSDTIMAGTPNIYTEMKKRLAVRISTKRGCYEKNNSGLRSRTR